MTFSVAFALFFRTIDGLLRYGTVRYGTVRYGTVRYGTVRYATVRYATVRYATVRYGTVRYGTVRYGTVRYGALKNSDKFALPIVSFISLVGTSPEFSLIIQESILDSIFWKDPVSSKIYQFLARWSFKQDLARSTLVKI
jgi:hypothetical protein